ncbi:porin, partial [Klebsiella variicola]|uniref:porin n=1 Tax=Klebsiella variicola TaxID=244366 RepID=UPI0039C17ED0
RDRMDGEEQGTYYKNLRLAVKTWTGQETELGTLKTYTETRFQLGNINSGDDLTGRDTTAGNKSVSLIHAWIQLGGLRVGKD